MRPERRPRGRDWVGSEADSLPQPRTKFWHQSDKSWGSGGKATSSSIRCSPAYDSQPFMLSFIELLTEPKRWLLGTHQGAVSGAHLDYYLDEFTYRFNRRPSRSR